MLRNTIISSFRRLPKGLLIVAALFLITESFLYVNRAELVRDYWNKILVNEQQLIEIQEDFDYLIMGDSVQKTGIIPSRVDDRILNLGLPGAKPLGQYLLLRRYLAQHKPPKAIFLYVDPEDPHDSLHVILRYFVSLPEFLFVFRDLSGNERMRFVMRYWVSLDERKVALTKRREYRGDNEEFIRRIKESRGYIPAPTAEEKIPDDHFATHRVRRQRGVSISKRDMTYLNEFIKLARSKDIEIIFFGFLLPRELHGILEESGFNDDYLVFFATLKKLYPDAYFVDKPILFLDNSYFGDHSHLNRGGAEAYTQYFKAIFTNLKRKGAL